PWRVSDGGDLGFADHAELAADAVFDCLEHLGVVPEEELGVLAPLAEPLAAVREPGAGLLDDPFVDGEVEEIARARDAFAVHDVEFRFAERWRHLALDDLHARTAADHGVPV